MHRMSSHTNRNALTWAKGFAYGILFTRAVTEVILTLGQARKYLLQSNDWDRFYVMLGLFVVALPPGLNLLYILTFWNRDAAKKYPLFLVSLAALDLTLVPCTLYAFVTPSSVLENDISNLRFKESLNSHSTVPGNYMNNPQFVKTVCSSFSEKDIPLIGKTGAILDHVIREPQLQVIISTKSTGHKQGQPRKLDKEHLIMEHVMRELPERVRWPQRSVIKLSLPDSVVSEGRPLRIICPVDESPEGPSRSNILIAALGIVIGDAFLCLVCAIFIHSMNKLEISYATLKEAV